MRALGFPRNLGGPVISVRDYRDGNPGKKPRPKMGGVWPSLGANQSGVETVFEGEGNEAGRDGWQGVGASNITDEAGEPTRRDPVEGRGRHSDGTFEGKDAGNIET